MASSCRSFRVLLAASGIAFALAASVATWLPGCDESPGSTQCIESISPTTATVAAGSYVTFAVTVGNPDNDNVGGVTVSWSASGGGTLDRDQTTLSLIDQTDDLGNPAGTLGTTSDAYLAAGPAGTYTLEVSVSSGDGCLAQSLPPVILEVTGTLPPDAGAPDGSSEGGEDAGGEDASGVDAAGDGAAEEDAPPADAGSDSEASDAAPLDAADGE